ncbi:hypothetical protein FNH13_04095 [Ornithinimicrobium ciconiae]|uniref:DNA-directed RNA polymerase subunit beta n=1 Tax=Ornithinimicrobium ciconiae TaxID=2594265 RepID=A0A516G8D3_9MICO|nr:hypothetical protein [Ornithinimicrobium ciconiae]QDO87620.1 hypothetical protein FNH13_04095 [Ornithinimicrobium ciconiae]
MRFHKPIPMSPESIDAQTAAPDQLEVAEMAHRSAAVLVDRGRASDDPQLLQRLVDLPRTVGLQTLAEVWSARPARTLPGALWRLYVLDEWVQRSPESVAQAFTAGAAHAEVYRVISGVVEPPRPEDLQELTHQILNGIYEGDLDVALERAAAFCHVTATGLAVLHGDGSPVTQDEAHGSVELQRAARLQDTAADLQACAKLWLRGDLH